MKCLARLCGFACEGLAKADLCAVQTQTSERPAVTIREDKAGHIIWSGLREVRVSNASEVMGYLESGSAIRQTGQTAMNDQSSRSHAIFSLTLTQNKYTGQLSPSSPSSTHAAPSATTPSRLAHRQSIPMLSSRVASPTPASGSRPGTPARSGLAPRPSSVQGSTRTNSPLNKDDEERSPARAPEQGDWVTVTSKFHFVDLAGSERVSRTPRWNDVKDGRERRAENLTFSCGSPSSRGPPLSGTAPKRASPSMLVCTPSATSSQPSAIRSRLDILVTSPTATQSSPGCSRTHCKLASTSAARARWPVHIVIV